MVARLSATLGMPITILDTETTGIPGAKQTVGVVEWAYIQIRQDGTTTSESALVNPGMDIPWQACKVHRINNADVRDKPRLDAHAATLLDLLQHTVICGFNSREFDIPVLCDDLARNRRSVTAPIMQLDVRDVWRDISAGERGKLAEVAQTYGVTPDGAHRAMADAMTTALTLERMLTRHGMEAVIQCVRNNHFASRPQVAQPAPDQEQQPSASVKKSKRPRAVRPKRESDSGEKNQNQRIAEAARTRLGDGNSRLTPADLTTIADITGNSLATVSIQLGKMMESGELSADVFVDAVAQDLLRTHLADAIAAAGGRERLKPIKEWIDKKSGQSIDYMQLRAALLIEEQCARNLAQSRRNNQEWIARTKNPPKSLMCGQGPGRAGGFSETVGMMRR